MAPFQAFYLFLSVGVFALAWLRGGHTERAGVMALIIAFLASYPVQVLHLGQMRYGEALIDVILLLVFLRLAVRGDRWWPMAASAGMILVLVVHLSVLLVPGLDTRADVAARWGLGILVILTLLGGVVERWLSGEPPVSPGARWTTPRRT